MQPHSAHEEVIDISTARFARFNPKTRTKDVSKLAKSIEENSQLRPITVVKFPDGKLHVADGHRTINALLMLGEKQVKARILTPDDDQSIPVARDLFHATFRALNEATKSFNGRDKLNVGLRGGPVFDNSTRSAQHQLEMLFPEKEERQMLIDAEVTTTVLNIAKRSARYVMGDDVDPDSDAFLARVKSHILYILRNPVQQPLTAYMRLDFDRRALREAIDGNKPPPRVSTPLLKANWVRLDGSVKKTRVAKN